MSIYNKYLPFSKSAFVIKQRKYVLTIRILDRQSERIIKFTRKIGKGLVTADRDKSFAFLFPFRPPLISVLLRRHSIECLEFSAKISHIFKACCLSDNGNAVFGFRKKLGGTLQTIFQNIIYGRCMQIAFKNIQHTAFAYGNSSCNVLQGYATIIVFVDILHHYLQLCLCLCGGFGGVLIIILIYAFGNQPPQLHNKLGCLQFGYAFRFLDRKHISYRIKHLTLFFICRRYY